MVCDQKEEVGEVGVAVFLISLMCFSLPGPSSLTDNGA